MAAALAENIQRRGLTPVEEVPAYEQAAPTFKRGYGFHPVCAFVDHGPEGSTPTGRFLAMGCRLPGPFLALVAVLLVATVVFATVGIAFSPQPDPRPRTVNLGTGEITYQRGPGPDHRVWAAAEFVARDSVALLRSPAPAPLLPGSASSPTSCSGCSRRCFSPSGFWLSWPDQVLNEPRLVGA